MPLSKIDEKPALIVIDLQKGIVGLPTAHPTTNIVGNAAALARGFRSQGFPVVLVNVAGGAPGRADITHDFKPPENWTELVPELEQNPSDHVVTKFRWGAFHDTGLDLHLKKLGVTQVVVCGIATSIGVESTARHAHELGFHVVVVEDAMTDLDGDAHAHSVTKILPKLGEVSSTSEVLSTIATS